MDSFQPLLVIAVTLVMGWFAGGVIWNIRRGNAVLKWMQAGLPALGEKTTLRWLGTSAVELGIAKAKPPFRRFELVVILEPRDVPWLWIWSHQRGRRDMLILRGQLGSAPRLEYDLVAPESWTGRSALRTAEQRKWGSQELDELRFLAPKASLPVSRQGAPQLLETARRIHPHPWWLAVRREYPQLELHIPLPNPNTSDAKKFFDAVRALGQQDTGN
ncbi:MAG TPA: hypothetical protein VJ436_06570 [Anaerolineales bacterium]|nr:hypothetical protein [Anaerolineales bacterium]